MKNRFAVLLVASVWLFGGSMAVGMASSHAHAPSTQIVVNADGSSDLYACEEDSPPPCVWDCATMGNRVCG